MNVLFFGDIVGKKASEHVASILPDLREENSVNLAVANAENCLVSGPAPENGFGMSLELVELLLDSGVDVITSGNHAWDGPESKEVLSHPRVLRPLNLPDSYQGQGALSLEVSNETVTVVNLVGQTAMKDALPLEDNKLVKDTRGVTLIDFHGESAVEKQVFAHAVDGKVAAVFGTHTHEPTLPLHILSGGTALVVDVGMTGPSGGVAGIDPRHFSAGSSGVQEGDVQTLALARGPLQLGAVLMSFEAGKTRSLCRL